jgi:hypothetical protein
MKLAHIFLLLFMISPFAQARGLYCGTRGTFFGTLASDIAIPDYFPPEKFIAQIVLGSMFPGLSLCADFEPVYLGSSCLSHDQCYKSLGAIKDECDTTLLGNWQQSCAERYNASSELSSLCLSTCNSVVEFMYGVMRYDDGTFCPSCEAFERDQEEARNIRIF